MKKTLLIVVLSALIGCSGKPASNRNKQQTTRSQNILKIVDSIISTETDSRLDNIQSEASHINAARLYDLIAEKESVDGQKILSLKKTAEIYEKISGQEGDTLFVYDLVYILPESGMNLKSYVFSPSEAFMSYNGERAYSISENKISELKNWINQNNAEAQPSSSCYGASYAAGYLFKVTIKNGNLLVNKCRDIQSKALPTKKFKLLNRMIDSVYQTKWLIQEIGNKAKEKCNIKKRNRAFNRLNYNQTNDDIYFVEDIYNYECWALWCRKELIYCYNGKMEIYKKPSITVEKLFDNFQEEEISDVLSDKAINIFPHRKKYISTFFVAKISIRDSLPCVLYVKRFKGFF